MKVRNGLGVQVVWVTLNNIEAFINEYIEELKKCLEAKRHRKEAVKIAAENLQSIKVLVKYIIFDLEATRREKVFLVKKLNDKG